MLILITIESILREMKSIPKTHTAHSLDRQFETNGLIAILKKAHEIFATLLESGKQLQQLSFPYTTSAVIN